MKHAKAVYILLFCIGCLKGFAQDAKKQPLLAILPKIEEQFEIKFSYADADLKDVLVTAPDIKKKSLKELISALQQETQLSFKKLDDRYYTITRLQYATICALVVDGPTQQPVVGATIEVLENNSGIITNIDGVFTLEQVPLSATLRIRYLGYEPYYVYAHELTNTNRCKTLYLNPKREHLEEVVVYHFLTAGLQKQQDGSTTLNTADFGILPGLVEPDVLQTIQALPGIKSINETVSNINIRGGTNDQNLMLWDGIKMYQSGHFFGLISAFNPYLTESVDIIKNGTSAQFTDGVSGTINMKSLNTLTNNTIGGAGFNLVSTDLYGQIPITEKIAFQFSGRRAVTDFLNTPTYNQYFNRAFQDSKITNTQNQEVDQDITRKESFYFYDFSAKFLYDINNNHKLRVSFININNNLDYAETLRENNESETKESTLDQNNLAFGGSLNSKWSEQFSTEISSYYTKYNLDSKNLTLLTDQRVLLNNQVLETGIKLNTFFTFNNITLLNGYQFYEVGITNAQDVNIPEFKLIDKDVLRNHAIFSEVSYTSFNKKTFLRAGVRANYIEKFGEFIFEPRLNFSQELLPHFLIEVQGEFKNQTANQLIDLEQDFLGVEKRRWVLANNSDLPVTKSKQASLGFNYNNNGLYVGLEGFYKKVNGVTTSNQGFQNQDQFEDAPGAYGYIGLYDVMGLEFLINKKTNKYSTWLSYTYNSNNYTFKDIVPSEFPNNLDVTHALTFAGTYIYNNFKLGVGLNWHTGKPYTEPDPDNPVSEGEFENTINYQSPNSSRLDDYFRVDASATYNFKLSKKVKATLGAAILNVTNKKNTLNIYYRLNDKQDTEVQRVENISLGITPNFTFRVQF